MFRLTSNHAFRNGGLFTNNTTDESNCNTRARELGSFFEDLLNIQDTGTLLESSKVWNCLLLDSPVREALTSMAMAWNVLVLLGPSFTGEDNI